MKDIIHRAFRDECLKLMREYSVYEKNENKLSNMTAEQLIEFCKTLSNRFRDTLEIIKTRED